jgi:biotin synthase-related radical SAM superfamily protein
MNDKSVLVVQNCIDLLKVVTGSCSNTCQMSSDSKSHVISLKDEDVTDIQEEKLVTLPAIESEHEVSCLYIPTHFTYVQNE